MKKYLKYIVFVFVISVLVVLSCNKKDTSKLGNDTILEGTISILTDETLVPIVQDQVDVFQTQYNAKITLVPKSEKESIMTLVNLKKGVVILSRELNKNELAVFRNRKITPRVTPFATDAIALIKNKRAKDTIIDLKNVVDFVKGNKSTIKGLVFDNPNSSTVSYLCMLAGVNELPKENVFSFNTNDEVIKYVSENDGLIGVVGINWLSQPMPNMVDYVNKVSILSVKGSGNEYVYPSQENIGLKKYPLARDLYIINCQGYDGLGIGFSSFVAGEIGQRIILKSGLVPVRIPSRNITTRDKI